MEGELGDDAGRAGRRRTVADLATATGLFLAAVVGFSSWYSASLLDRGAFAAFYRQGVYGHRVLGRELALLIARAVGDPLGDHLVLGGRRPLAGGMATAVLVIDAIALLVIVALAGSLLARRRVPEPARTLVVLVLTVLLVLSQSTLTPYDLPAAALVLGALAAADRRPPVDLLAVVLVGVGVATRESALVAVAALVAARWVDRPAHPSRRRDLVAALALVAGIATYVVLLAASAAPTLWEAITLRGNLARVLNWLGLGLMAGGWLLWRRAAQLAGLDGPAERRLVAWCWLLSAPYLVMALLVGYWFEVRLLVPLLVVELWARTRTGQGQEVDSRQSSSPTGDDAKRSSSSTTSAPAGSS